MNKIKFYKYAIWALLLLNITVLAFFTFTKPKPHHQAQASNNFQTEVVKTLNLNSQQESSFRNLAEAHNQQMKSINKQQEQLLLPYFESLAITSDSVDNENILNDFQNLEREKMEMTYQHFQEVKALLNDEQLPQFKGLIKRFIDKILLDNKKKPPPPKDFN